AVAAGEHIGERAAREVRGGEAVADVAACPRDARRRVVAHGGVPVARHPERAAPAVGDGGIPDRGKQLAERAPQMLEDAIDAVVLGPDGAAPVVARAATAEGETVVCRALTVDQQVAVVAEGAAVRDADLVPEGARQGL